MNISKYKYAMPRLLAIILCCTMSAACADDIEAGKAVDEKQYETIYENNGFLRDARTNSVSNIVDLYEDFYETALMFGLTKAPAAAISGTVSIDEGYLASYNKEYGTSFELFPRELVKLTNDGVLSVSANSFESSHVDVTITAGSALEEDKTYAIPFTLNVSGGDVTLKDGAAHCIYLVQDMRKKSDCFKGENLPKGYLFYEVNSTNPLNTFAFELENGKLLWDVVVIFAANIKYSSAENRAYVYCNENVQFLLANNEEYLQPLRKRGVKVLLGLLGGGDQSGLAQLSEIGAKDFAKELAQYCYTYNLDGVNFDDEYSSSPDLTNPMFAPRGTAAAARLCYETKRAMPDKLVTVYNYGSMYGTASVDGVDADEWIDIVVPDYPAGAPYPLGNMTNKKIAYQALEFMANRGSNLTAYSAQTMLNQGYGWYMGFALDPGNFGSVVDRMPGIETLYGVPLKEPTFYYKKNDLTVYPWSRDLVFE